MRVGSSMSFEFGDAASRRGGRESEHDFTARWSAECHAAEYPLRAQSTAFMYHVCSGTKGVRARVVRNVARVVGIFFYLVGGGGAGVARGFYPICFVFREGRLV